MTSQPAPAAAVATAALIHRIMMYIMGWALWRCTERNFASLGVRFKPRASLLYLFARNAQCTRENIISITSTERVGQIQQHQKRVLIERINHGVQGVGGGCIHVLECRFFSNPSQQFLLPRRSDIVSVLAKMRLAHPTFKFKGTARARGASHFGVSAANCCIYVG